MTIAAIKIEDLVTGATPLPGPPPEAGHSAQEQASVHAQALLQASRILGIFETLAEFNRGHEPSAIIAVEPDVAASLEAGFAISDALVARAVPHFEFVIRTAAGLPGPWGPLWSELGEALLVAARALEQSVHERRASFAVKDAAMRDSAAEAELSSEAEALDRLSARAAGALADILAESRASNSVLAEIGARTDHALDRIEARLREATARG